jgi:hypothetical protein
VSSPVLFGLVFNALLALKATGVGHRTISGLRAPARGFADDLALVARWAADMSRLVQVVADLPPSRPVRHGWWPTSALGPDSE